MNAASNRKIIPVSRRDSIRDLPHVVIIGGGFGGLNVAKRLRRIPVRITLLDKYNHHLFKPLLYQVATSGLSPADIAMPIRSIFSGQKNVTVLMEEAIGIDLKHRLVKVVDNQPIHYDYLILATGSDNNYFGNSEWPKHAPGLKTLEDATEIRRRILIAYEMAEKEHDEKKKMELMTFLIIGGGPTGIELAGAIAELGRRVLVKDFRNIDPSQTRVILLEGKGRILEELDEKLSKKAVAQLQDLGVEVRCNTMVTKIEKSGLHIGDQRLAAGTILWTAGVKGNSLANNLGVALDHMNRIRVTSDCSIPGHQNAFAIGDVAYFVPNNAKLPLPGTSPVAIQEARSVADNIIRDLKGIERKPFTFVDQGIMATIGRSRAVAQIGRIQVTGLLAWFIWLLVHIWNLIGFRNRIIVIFSWFWSYVMFRSGARLVTADCQKDERKT